MDTFISQTRYVWMLFIGTMFFQSCTKNELIEYERTALNKIIEYRVVNNPQHMMGAIDHEQNTIKIFIPYYTNLDYLIGNIKLDEGATLLRIDSTEINLLEDELDPVAVGDTVQYIVRSAAGQYRTYTLTQEVLPHNAPLSILGYGNMDRMGAFNFAMHSGMDTAYLINANREVYLFGNFLSSSAIGKFTLTNRTTGVEHNDYVRIISTSPIANDLYVMTARISPEAAFGTYDVKIEHQGRTTELPPMEIFYKLSYGENYSSSTGYVQGDTIVFNASSATFAKPRRLFARVNRSTRDGDVPANFPESTYGQELEMKIVSSSRTEIKAIFPDIPAGLYRNWQYNVINLVAVFETEEGFDNPSLFNSEVQIALPSGLGFTVLARE